MVSTKKQQQQKKNDTNVTYYFHDLPQRVVFFSLCLSLQIVSSGGTRPSAKGRGLFCLPCRLFFLLWFVPFLPQITGRGANSPRSATGIDEQWIRSLEAIRGKHAVRNCFIFRVWIFETPGGTAFWAWGQSFRGTRAQSDFVNNVIYWQNVVFFEEIKFWKKSNTSIVFNDRRSQWIVLFESLPKNQTSYSF